MFNEIENEMSIKILMTFYSENSSLLSMSPELNMKKKKMK